MDPIGLPSLFLEVEIFDDEDEDEEDDDNTTTEPAVVVVEDDDADGLMVTILLPGQWEH
jgi:hypothetical protein